MQMVKKGIMFLALVWIALIVLMPKQELYFKLEQELAANDIVVSGELVDEDMFGMDLEHLTVYVKGIKVATIEEASFFTLLFYSSVSLEGVKLDSLLKRYAPEQIDSAVVTHSLLSPMRVGISGQGVFGEASGSVYLSDRTLNIVFEKEDALNMIKSKLKKGEEGWIYETSF